MRERDEGPIPDRSVGGWTWTGPDPAAARRSGRDGIQCDPIERGRSRRIPRALHHRSCAGGPRAHTRGGRRDPPADARGWLAGRQRQGKGARQASPAAVPARAGCVLGPGGHVRVAAPWTRCDADPNSSGVRGDADAASRHGRMGERRPLAGGGRGCARCARGRRDSLRDAPSRRPHPRGDRDHRPCHAMCARRGPETNKGAYGGPRTRTEEVSSAFGWHLAEQAGAAVLWGAWSGLGTRDSSHVLESLTRVMDLDIRRTIAGPRSTGGGAGRGQAVSAAAISRAARCGASGARAAAGRHGAVLGCRIWGGRSPMRCGIGVTHVAWGPKGTDAQPQDGRVAGMAPSGAETTSDRILRQWVRGALIRQRTTAATLPGAGAARIQAWTCEQQLQRLCPRILAPRSGGRRHAPARPRIHGEPIGSLPRALFCPRRTMLQSPAGASGAARVVASPDLAGTRGTLARRPKLDMAKGVPEPSRVKSGMAQVGRRSARPYRMRRITRGEREGCSHRCPCLAWQHAALGDLPGAGGPRRAQPAITLLPLLVSLFFFRSGSCVFFSLCAVQIQEIWGNDGVAVPLFLCSCVHRICLLFIFIYCSSNVFFYCPSNVP
ncbi:hypothetical protein SETIT_6G192100v2 [Setaria italica]|uniref:Uncharacterized protein n=1 Tax=Setaria italica TaxID=4555 RepID=A0A368RN51_SETIT|nr:hypothetical protein SETIT_6G192100v2 [Setaria italica]